MIITIDGPTASGKTTASIKLAQHLGYYCINSGLLYRTLAHVLLNTQHTALDQLAALDRSAIESALARIQVGYGADKSQMIINIDGIPINPSILKIKQLDKASSFIALNKQARQLLTHLQRQLAQKYYPIVIEGRDAGTVVFPQADIKFFLTADPTVRAVRWFNDQKKSNDHFLLSHAADFVNERDKRDQERPISPLHSASDAVIIDNSTDQKSDDTIQRLVDYIKKRER